MILAGDPKVHIRAKETRSAWNGLFVHEETLHTSEEHHTLVTHARGLRPAMYAGEVDTRGYFNEGAVEAAGKAITKRVEALLIEYGLLSPRPGDSFLWNSRLMRTRGAPYHHDGHNNAWHKSLFWVYVVDVEDVDFRMPNLGLTLPMERGQLLVFDPLQAHGVVKKGATEFLDRHFNRNRMQVFLSGDMAYPDSFWKQLDVETRPSMLRKPKYQELESLMVMERDGEVLPRNYASA